MSVIILTISVGAVFLLMANSGMQISTAQSELDQCLKVIAPTLEFVQFVLGL